MSGASEFTGRYDVAVIGTGPGGVSAAITAKIRNKSVLLLGSPDLTGKLVKGHKILNYPGLPEVTGDELTDALKKHLESLDITITEDRIASVLAMDDYFMMLGSRNDMPYEATSIIIASGVVADKPIPGEVENLGNHVSYCATCDAMLYRNKPVVVVGYNEKEEEEAVFLAGVCSEVLYFPQYKVPTRWEDGSADPAAGKAPIKVVREKAASIAQDPTGTLMNPSIILTTAEGNSYPTACIFVLRESIAPGQLVPGLETEGAHIKVDMQMRTNLPGCFACGDITGTPYQYIKAAGQGNVAALSASSYVDGIRAKAKAAQ
ncbi:MAG: NAD(P)/FAD-dependent oxidoreductase [Firmicutes bacterium]|nr:NAD(P)/FAD-dependent oxidoreductase [Bacillota bacterium]